ncbi:hypothetical protein WJX81_000730 [Elliptochloris bilobata]|uniref:Eukaryotic translation initiation factor 3 30 kDa subunit n=1 Tax=Elliptochloris bilobata TaxID=381761 RepID=A0AAW1RD10_9CHLO
MADDWEDWDEEEALSPAAAAATNGAVTKGQVVLAKANEPDASKFADEDAEEEEAPAWEKSIPKPQQKKEAVSRKLYEDKGKPFVADEGPLDDPIAEKLRQQKLVEEADLQAAMDLFGADLDLDKMQPRSAKDFEDLARALAAKYLHPHGRSPHYKALVKALVKAALGPMDVQQAKDMEVCLAGVRADKVKEETAAKAAKKASGKKKVLNVGRSGGSAGLDDYQYDEALDGEDVEFM